MVTHGRPASGPHAGALPEGEEIWQEPRGGPRTASQHLALLRREIASNSIGALGAAIILLVVLVALFAGAIAPHDPTAQLAQRLQPPSAAHLLGTDEFGRDQLSRLVYGSRISLYVGVLAVALALSTGATIGIVAGYFGGTVDNLVMRVIDSVFAFPSLLLAIAITGILGPSLTNAMFAIAIVSAPTYARL